jgi:hypothetical protein
MSVFERGVRLGRRSALLAAWIAAIAAESTAETQRWNVSSTGTFNIAGNWFRGVPGPGDVARFGITDTSLQRAYTVRFSNDPTNLQFVVEDDNVTFDLNGHTYAATNACGLCVAAAIGTVPDRCQTRLNA